MFWHFCRKFVNTFDAKYSQAGISHFHVVYLSCPQCVKAFRVGLDMIVVTVVLGFRCYHFITITPKSGRTRVLRACKSDSGVQIEMKGWTHQTSGSMHLRKCNKQALFG